MTPHTPVGTNGPLFGAIILAGIVSAGWLLQRRRSRHKGQRTSGTGHILARDGRHVVRGSADSHTLAIGPSRSGKTSSVIIPNVIAWDRGSVVAVSTKQDVLLAAGAAAAARGDVYVLDVLGVVPDGALPPGARRIRWSPLRGCSSWSVARARAGAMMGATRRADVTDAAHWATQGERMLAPVLHAAALEGLSLGTVMGWVRSADSLRAPLALLQGYGADEAAGMLDGIVRQDPKPRDSIIATVATALHPYAGRVLEEADAAMDLVGRSGPEKGRVQERASVDSFWRGEGGFGDVGARDAACGASWSDGESFPLVNQRSEHFGPRNAAAGTDASWDPYTFLNGRNTLFIIAPLDSEVEDPAPIVVGILAELYGAIRTVSDAMGGRLPYQAVWVLDEVASISPLPRLPAWLAESAGRGLTMILGTQDFAQLAERWGRQAAASMWSNLTSKVVFPGVANPETLHQLEALGGKTWVSRESRTDSRGHRQRSRSTTTGWHEVPRWPAQRVYSVPSGRCLVFRPDLPEPRLLRQARWFGSRA